MLKLNLFQKIEALNRSNEELVRLAHAAWTMTQQMTHAAEHDALTGLAQSITSERSDWPGDRLCAASREPGRRTLP